MAQEKKEITKLPCWKASHMAYLPDSVVKDYFKQLQKVLHRKVTERRAESLM